MAEAVPAPLEEQQLTASPSPAPSSWRVKAALNISAWTLIFSGYLSLSTVREIGVPILLFPILLLLLTPIGERLDQRWRLYNLLTRAFAITYLCFIPLSVMVFGLTDAVVTLIMFIQMLILLHTKSEREYLLLFLMSFFLLLAACVQSPEPAIGLAMFVFLVSAIWSFLTLRLYAEEQQCRALSAPEILSLDVLHSGTGAAKQSLFDRGLVGAIAGLSLMSILLTIGVFAFVPRIEAGFFGRGEGDTSSTDLDEIVDLMDDEFLDEDDTPVMFVKFPDLESDELPTSESLYWRSTTMGKYENSQWTRVPLSSHLDPRLILPAPQTPPQGGGFQGQGRRPPGQNFGGGGGFGAPQVNFQNTRWEISRRRREDTDLLHYTVYMPEMPATGVPALDLVFRIRITDRDGRSRLGWDWYRDYTATIQRRGKRQLDYEAWSEVSEQDTAAMRQVSGDAAALWAERGLAFDYETYTRHDLLESTQDKIRELTGGEDSTYDKATAIERWLISSDFEYTLELPPLPKSHPIDAFMTEVRAGHCERFATAMALSMRSLGVPSRVVSGYLGAELNESDDSYIVRKSMAHLWVEVWIPDFGWVRFDPSPSGDAIRLSPFQRMTLMFSRQRLKAQMLWYREVVGFSGAFQLERLKEFTLGVVRGFSIPGETSVGEALDADSPIKLPLGVILLASAATLFLLIVRRAWRGKKKQKWKLTEDQRRSVGLYHTLKQRLRRCGLPSTGDTAGALLDALDAGGRAPLGIVRPMIEVYNEVRFGHRPLTRERYAELVQQIKRLQPATE